MSRAAAAARNAEISATFFRVDGADQETGEETYLVLQATTKPQAEKLARQQGLLISSIRVARPDDWAAPTSEAQPPAAPSASAMSIYSDSPIASDTGSQGELLDEYTSEPQGSATDDPAAGEADAPAPQVFRSEPTRFIEAAPSDSARQDPTASESAQSRSRSAQDAEPAAAQSPGGSSAAAVVLACIGGALLIGGVLALSLALWPDNDSVVRNELQKIDYRLHEVSQMILGSMLVLGGLMTFTLAIICYLLPRRPSRP